MTNRERELAGKGLEYAEGVDLSTSTYHTTNFGKFAGYVEEYANHDGYVTYYPNIDYSDWSDEQLADLCENEDTDPILKATAATECAERAINAWREENS
jgi:hypothetical protein